MRIILCVPREWREWTEVSGMLLLTAKAVQNLHLVCCELVLSSQESSSIHSKWHLCKWPSSQSLTSLSLKFYWGPFTTICGMVGVAVAPLVMWLPWETTPKPGRPLFLVLALSLEIRNWISNNCNSGNQPGCRVVSATSQFHFGNAIRAIKYTHKDNYPKVCRCSCTC